MMERRMRECLLLRKEEDEREAEGKESPFRNHLSHLCTPHGSEAHQTQSFQTRKALHRAS